MRAILILLIRVYQRTLSRIIPNTCRFYPSCSEYFIEALQKKGLLRGAIMGVWRVLRCHPLNDGGYDPVE